MKIKRFVNKTFNYDDTFSVKELWKLYKYESLKIMAEKQPQTEEDFREFELAKGDGIWLVGQNRSLGHSRYIGLEEIGKVSGVGAKLKENIRDILGDTFTLEDLEVNSDSIKGLGPATLKRINKL